MPTYQWRCKSCGTIQDVIRKPDEYRVPPDEQCCDKPDRHKHFSKAPQASFATSWAGGGGGKGRW